MTFDGLVVPEGGFRCIIADPPWPYKQFSKAKGIAKRYGSVLSQYPTLTIEEIKSFPVADITDKQCVLFLWATMPNLEYAFDVIKAWGFIYKTCAYTWVKLNPSGNGIYSGLGHWTNGNAELCLLATKKAWPRRVVKNSKQIQLHARGRHSEKPTQILDEIVRLIGDVPRIELFARRTRPGWTVWGNEVNT